MLIAIFIAHLSLSALFALRNFAEGKENAVAESELATRVAVESLGDEVAARVATVRETAMEPDLPPLLMGDRVLPDCALSSSPSTGLFSSDHLHFVSAHGSITCTSFPGNVGGLSYRAVIGGATASPDGVLRTGVFLDPVTGQRSIAFIAPVLVDARIVGYVMSVIGLDSTAVRLTERLDERFPELTYALYEPLAGQVIGRHQTGEAGPPPRVPSLSPQSWLSSEPSFWAENSIPGTSVIVYAAMPERLALAEAWAGIREVSVVGLFSILVAILGLSIVNRRIASPMSELRTQVEASVQEQEDRLVEPAGPDEVRSVGERINEMLEARAVAREKLERLAFVDAETDLPNAARLAERIRSGDEDRAVLVIGFDRLDRASDAFGRASIASIQRDAAMRLRPLTGDDLVFRIREHQLAVLASVPSRDAATDLAGACSYALSAPFVVASGSVELAPRIGICLLEGSAPDPDLAVRRASLALDEASRHGARFRVFDESLQRDAERRANLEHELRRGIAAGGIEVWYQPIADLSTGATRGVEALARWRTSEGVLPPAAFLEVAEETGLVVRLERTVVGQAIDEASRWQAVAGAPAVTVNLSTQSLWEDDTPGMIGRALERAQLTPRHLIVEVRAPDLEPDPWLAERVLQRIRATGARISIEDISLSPRGLEMLRRLPLHQIKLDRSLVATAGTDPFSAELIVAQHRIAEALGVELVAEGVETREQADALLELGIRTGQGFLFGGPSSTVPLFAVAS